MPEIKAKPTDVDSQSYITSPPSSSSSLLSIKRHSRFYMSHKNVPHC